MKELGIYIHIPFCMKKCEYCDFLSFSNNKEKVKDYINAVIEEIKNTKIEGDYRITTIYFGGRNTFIYRK